MFVKNYLDLGDFFSKNNIIFNSKYYYLLAYLYDHFGFENKNKIKEVILSVDSEEYKNY